MRKPIELLKQAAQRRARRLILKWMTQEMGFNYRVLDTWTRLQLMLHLMPRLSHYWSI